MKKRMIPTTLSITVSMIGLLSGHAAHAQAWGSGMYGAAPVCPYNQVAAAAATSQNADQITDLLSESRELVREKRDSENKLKEFESKKETYTAALTETLADAWATKVIGHMENGYNCGCRPPGPSLAPPAEASALSLSNSSRDNQFDVGWSGGQYAGGDNGSSASICGPLDEITLSKPWKSVCRNGGGVAKEVCSVRYFLQTGGKDKKADCISAIEGYRKATTGADKLRQKVKTADERIKAIASQIKELRLEDQQDQSQMEANCPTGTCFRNRAVAPSNTANLSTALLPLGLGVLGGVGSQYNGLQNNNLGLQQPYQAGNFGYPFNQAGIYGSVAGGQQQGAFGCSGGIGGGGFMGGPNGMAGLPNMMMPNYGMQNMPQSMGLPNFGQNMGNMGMMPNMSMGVPRMGVQNQMGLGAMGFGRPGVGIGAPRLGGLPGFGMPVAGGIPGLGMPSMMTPAAYGNGLLGGGMYNPGMGSWGMAGLPGAYGNGSLGLGQNGGTQLGLANSYNSTLFQMQQLNAGASALNGFGGSNYGLGLNSPGLGGTTLGSYGALGGGYGLGNSYGLGYLSGGSSYRLGGYGGVAYGSGVPRLGGDHQGWGQHYDRGDYGNNQGSNVGGILSSILSSF